MKKNTILLVLLTFLATGITYAQESPKFDFRVGIGYSMLGTGDINTLNFENELNYKISNYFSSSVSLNFGVNSNPSFYSASFLQGNINGFISPFKNNQTNDLRIGMGLTSYRISDYLTIENYEYRKDFGYNVIIEDTYNLSDKFLIALKFFGQFYNEGDQNIGVMLKGGFKF